MIGSNCVVSAHKQLLKTSVNFMNLAELISKVPQLEPTISSFKLLKRKILDLYDKIKFYPNDKEKILNTKNKAIQEIALFYEAQEYDYSKNFANQCFQYLIYYIIYFIPGAKIHIEHTKDILLNLTNFIIREDWVDGKTGLTALNAIAFAGYEDIAAIFIEKKCANILYSDRAEFTPLNTAAKAGHPLVVHLLLDHGADASHRDKDGFTPLISASKSGHLDVVKILLDHGAYINEQDNYGFTPINSAAKAGHLDVVTLLLEHNADIEIADKYGFTPINSSSKAGYPEIVSLLLSHGANFERQDNYGFTPLNSASFGGHIEIVEMLLQKSADLNKYTNDVFTPLNSATFGGHVKIVELLLQSGADINIQNISGYTPIINALDKFYNSTNKIEKQNYKEILFSLLSLPKFKIILTARGKGRIKSILSRPELIDETLLMLIREKIEL